MSTYIVTGKAKLTPRMFATKGKGDELCAEYINVLKNEKKHSGHR